MRRRRAFIIWMGCLWLGATGLGLSSCSAELVPVDVSYSPFEPTALVWIAQDQRFFSDNGLSVTFHEYDTGPEALDAMLRGEVDLAVGVGEFPMVGKVLQQTQARVLASIDRSEIIGLVARKDRGISEAADLEGKKIGTTRGTVAEFFLGRFLEINGLDMRDVTIVDLKTPKEWVDAVATGKVDAVATAEPHATLAAERLGENAIVWSAHGGQPMFGLVVATHEWLATRSEVAERFLRALAQAEDYAAQNPVEAQAIVQKALGLAPAAMPAVWERNQFAVTLDQSLVAAMEDEARWLISKDLVSVPSVPDVMLYLWDAGLIEVRPEAVDIVGGSAE